ncbi:MAG: SMP-30/gluconolactonase/LRE family protein, partial [Thermoanaerobaculia bacterium]|nr:SMP-30/gluconolactonase/LRE family protein [Thermoanaerobaculia bacterium]
LAALPDQQHLAVRLFQHRARARPTTGDVYACANAGPGVGGMTRFDGVRWTGFNEHQYGLGVPWPFPNDNCQAVGMRPSTGEVASNPTYDAIHQWDGDAWSDLGGMSESVGLIEDSLGRLWSLGEYFDLRYHDGTSWIDVPHNGSWGQNIQRDPSRAGTVWVSTFGEVLRTDGSYRFSRQVDDFPQLNPQSDQFSTVAPAPDGIAWVGSTQGLFRLDSNTGGYQYFTSLGGVSVLGARPLAVTPDGRLWFNVFAQPGSPLHGLGWYDGVNVGTYQAPLGGEPQWGGLPHAQIAGLEVRTTANGYELWMSCLSRGLSVLSVPAAGIFGDGFESGDFRAWSVVVP